MRPTTDYCKTQVIRLMGLANFPAKEGAIELMHALARHALSEAHAESIITTALDASKWCPTPADLRQFAADTMGEFLPNSRVGCRKCNGTGFIAPVYFLITWSQTREHRTAEQITPEQAANLRGKLTKTQEIVTAARPCDCLEAARLAMPPIEQPKSKRAGGKMRAAADVIQMGERA